MEFKIYWSESEFTLDFSPLWNDFIYKIKRLTKGGLNWVKKTNEKKKKERKSKKREKKHARTPCTHKITVKLENFTLTES